MYHTVMHYCYKLSALPNAKKYLSSLNIFALVLSGLCHDTSHPGHTNPFAVASGSKLAMRYNDKSVVLA